MAVWTRLHWRWCVLFFSPSGGEEDQTLFMEVLGDMHFKLRAAVLQAAETEDSWKAMERAALTRVVKQVFEEYSSAWEERFDVKLYPGRPDGTFRQECTFSDAIFDGLLVECFYSMLVDDATQQEIYDRLVWDATRMDDYIVKRRLENDLIRAAYTISIGVDEGSKICWECGAALATSNECTGCKAALYCGRKCQLKAWKGGHKGACSNLKVKHDHFVESLQLVDDAHISGLLEGMRLCQSFDYGELLQVHTQDNLGIEDGLGDPSMKYFYENLSRVILGEWWLFDESETPSVEEFKRITRAKGETEEDVEQHHFSTMTRFLAYDYVGFVGRAGVFEDPSRALAEIFGDLQQPLFRKTIWSSYAGCPLFGNVPSGMG